VRACVCVSVCLPWKLISHDTNDLVMTGAAPFPKRARTPFGLISLYTQRVDAALWLALSRSLFAIVVLFPSPLSRETRPVTLLRANPLFGAVVSGDVKRSPFLPLLPYRNPPSRCPRRPFLRIREKEKGSTCHFANEARVAVGWFLLSSREFSPLALCYLE